MKLSLDPNVGTDATAPGFMPRFYELYREMARKINGIAAGDIESADNSATAIPVIAATRGKFVRNSTPSELGTAGSKYVITGWLCTASGNPATFVACRSLTGG